MEFTEKSPATTAYAHPVIQPLAFHPLLAKS